eukprot:gene38-630_t
MFSWSFVPDKRFIEPDDAFFEEGDVACFQAARHSVKEHEIEDMLSCFSKIAIQNDASALVKCDYKGCKEIFTTTQAYELHQLSAHKFVCSICKRMFPSNFLLDLHITENHDSLFQARLDRGEPAFICLVESCSIRFCSEDERMHHLVNIHKYPSDYRFRSQRKHDKYKSKKSKAVSNNHSEKCEHEFMEVEAIENPTCKKEENENTSHAIKKDVKSIKDEASKSQIPKTISFGRGNPLTMKMLVFIATILVALATILQHAESACISDQHINGCSVPFNTKFPYATRFKPACDRHDVCYRCEIIDKVTNADFNFSITTQMLIQKELSLLKTKTSKGGLEFLIGKNVFNDEATSMILKTLERMSCPRKKAKKAKPSLQLSIAESFGFATRQKNASSDSSSSESSSGGDICD